MIKTVLDVIYCVSVIIGTLVITHTGFKVCGYIDWRKEIYVKDKKDKLSEKEWQSFEKVLDILDNDMGTEEFSNLMEEEEEDEEPGDS